MVRKELIEYFSYYLKKGKTVEELQKEALEKGYSKREIIDSFSSLGVNTDNIQKSNTGKIILLTFLIILVIIAIVWILLLNLKKEPKRTPSSEPNPIEERNLEELVISTALFNQSNIGTTEALESYFLNNPIEKQNSKKLSENFRDCINTNARFTKDIPELEGHFYIKNIGGENCLISYNSEITMDCNYTKNQLRLTHNEMKKKGMEDVTGPLFYLGTYLEIKFRMLGELIKQKINETYEKTGKIGNMTLGEDTVKEEINRTFVNPETGKKEIIKCLVY